MKQSFFLLLAFSLLTLAACSSTPSESTDAATNDASTDDAATDDASTDDAGHDAGRRVDAAVPVDAAPGHDADVARCSYVGVDEVIVLCDDDYTFVNHFTSDEPGCPEFYGFTPDGIHAASYAEAIASDATCDATCEWHFAIGVSRIYCGHRDGYEVLSAEGCDDVYRFGGEYYDSVEEHDRENPCP